MKIRITGRGGFGMGGLGTFIVMPNHVHGIIIINVGADLRVCPEPPEPPENDLNKNKRNEHGGERNEYGGERNEHGGEHIGSPQRNVLVCRKMN